MNTGTAGRYYRKQLSGDGHSQRRVEPTAGEEAKRPQPVVPPAAPYTQQQQPTPTPTQPPPTPLGKGLQDIIHNCALVLGPFAAVASVGMRTLEEQQQPPPIPAAGQQTTSAPPPRNARPNAAGWGLWSPCAYTTEAGAERAACGIVGAILFMIGIYAVHCRRKKQSTLMSVVDTVCCLTPLLPFWLMCIFLFGGGFKSDELPYEMLERLAGGWEPPTVGKTQP